MTKPKTATRTCGNCGESGHSIRTCQHMKAVSEARLKAADSKVVEIPLKKQA